jgi:HAD superfamily hydrolase (TIGR01509 family)
VTGSAKALISDLGNVVILFDHDRAHRSLGELLQLEPQLVHERLRASGLRRRMEIGAIASSDFPMHLLQALGSTITVSTEVLMQCWSDIFSLNEPMIDLLARVRRQVPIALLSNTDALHFRFISRHFPEVVGLFEGRHVLSYELRTVKPDVAIYAKALALVGCADQPSACVYVDDIPEFVAGARSLGINALQYRDHAGFVAQLERVGLGVG